MTTVMRVHCDIRAEFISLLMSREGHSHAGVLGRDAELSIAAYILEFGLTSHSIIIGMQYFCLVCTVSLLSCLSVQHDYSVHYNTSLLL